MKIFAKVIERLKEEFNGKLVWSYVTKSELQQCPDHDVDGLIEVLRNVQGTDMVVLFKEIESDKTKVCLRGKRGFNVFKIAKDFKGGGHLQAAGFINYQNIEKTIEIVLNKLKTYLV